MGRPAPPPHAPKKEGEKVEEKGKWEKEEKIGSGSLNFFYDIKDDCRIF